MNFLSAASSGNTTALALEYTNTSSVLATRSPTGKSALHLAAQHGHVAALRLLLSYGMDPTSTDNAGQTPLHLAAQGSSLETIALLLEHAGSDSTSCSGSGSGSPGSCCSPSPNLSNSDKASEESCAVRDHAGKTAIFYAYQNPAPGVLERFIDKAPECGAGCALTPEVVLSSSSGSGSVSSPSVSGSVSSSASGREKGPGDYFSYKRRLSGVEIGTVNKNTKPCLA